MLELKGYQRRSLEALESFLRNAVTYGAQKAFVLETNRPYFQVPQLPDLPYVCLRVPTGGGKTFMACHALAAAARSWLRADRVVCLWLVPSNAIREQTMNALRDREHPYRQTLNQSFSGQIEVLDLADALSVSRGTLDGATTIIVSTLAALRVEDTEGRKIYDPDGYLEHHFSGLTAEQELRLEKNDRGIIPTSLANVLRLRRPIVIMDEAHNARTHLSFQTLARFQPSCILEFTATPETTQKPQQELFASNIITHVSAAELKSESMVKLPIMLHTKSEWKEVVGEAIAAQKTLETAAREEEGKTGEYIRPIVLLQAQAHNAERETVTVEVLKKCLVEDFKIPEGQIAIATGQVRGIEDVDLFDRACEIRFIITVQALREGWDCSFAYILCSVSDVSTPRAVEQVLGRILRLPNATGKQHLELNCAYAFAASQRFALTAEALKDALIENGFQRMEADELVRPQEQEGQLPFGPLFEPIILQVMEAPDLSSLSGNLKGRITYDTEEHRLDIKGGISSEEGKQLEACFKKTESRELIKSELKKAQSRLESVSVKPATAPQKPFTVPLLGIRIGTQLELCDESHFLSEEWNLSACDAQLLEAEFPSTQAAGMASIVDVNKSGKVEVNFAEQLQEQLANLEGEIGWTIPALANWLDHQIPHKDIPQAHSSLFIHNVLSALTEKRTVTVAQLARKKFVLRTALEAKINQYRKAQQTKAYQSLLFGKGAEKLEVKPDLALTFEEGRYAPNWFCERSAQFRKHRFQNIGELESSGEEYDCAVFLDNLPEANTWIRNIAKRPDSSFWLPTSTDRFYPDFVVLLNDGRILVIEYKNAKDWSNDDSKEKRAVGELWAERSDGKCLFIMPKGPNFGEITAAIKSKSS